MFLKTFYIIFHRNIFIFLSPLHVKKRLVDGFSKKFMTLFERTKRRRELRFAAFCKYMLRVTEVLYFRFWKIKGAFTLGAKNARKKNQIKSPKNHSKVLKSSS